MGPTIPDKTLPSDVLQINLWLFKLFIDCFQHVITENISFSYQTNLMVLDVIYTHMRPCLCSTVLLNIPVLIVMGTISSINGILALTYYYDQGCDPLASRQISSPNQVIIPPCIQGVIPAPFFVPTHPTDL